MIALVTGLVFFVVVVLAMIPPTFGLVGLISALGANGPLWVFLALIFVIIALVYVLAPPRHKS